MKYVSKNGSSNTSAAEHIAKLKLRSDLPRVNLRPFLYIALGLVFGIIVYLRCRFGGARGTDFIFFIVLLALSIRPLSLKRTGAIFLCFLISALAGAGCMHLKCQSYLSGMREGDYSVTGTVVEFSIGDENAALTLDNVTLNGNSAKGKMYLTVPSEEVRAGDMLVFEAHVSRAGLPETGNSYLSNLFIKDVRYFATLNKEKEGGAFEVAGKGNYLLRLNASFYDVLNKNLSKTQADTAYALLTGNTGNMDDSFATAVRQGGVAHIFAVSGLHIGILYAAISLMCRRLKGFRVIPALAGVIVYSAFCGFSVSSVRAVIMCCILGIYNALGKKYDFLGAIAFAASAVLLFRPAEWLSAGFRLSFGACLGLALFSRSLKRAFRKLPRFLAEYLAANLSVQLFTLPILLDVFGYVSLWGTLLNLLLIPVLPVLFLGLFLAVIFALVIPPAAAVFLSVPNGMLSLFLWIFSFDYSLALTGFSLGAGSAVWVTGAATLSERVRLGDRTRVFCAIAFSALFMLTVVLQNAVFAGCKLIEGRGMVLAQTRTEHVLIINGALNASAYESFLMRHYSGELDAVIVVGSDTGRGISDALALHPKTVYASQKKDTGLWETAVLYDEEFTCGEMSFRFANAFKLVLTAQNRTVEIDFTGTPALQADLFLGEGSSGVYYLRKGAIYASQ